MKSFTKSIITILATTCLATSAMAQIAPGGAGPGSGSNGGGVAPGTSTGTGGASCNIAYNIFIGEGGGVWRAVLEGTVGVKGHGSAGPVQVSVALSDVENPEYIVTIPDKSAMYPLESALWIASEATGLDLAIQNAAGNIQSCKHTCIPEPGVSFCPGDVAPNAP
jgi:hypothetical protein